MIYEAGDVVIVPFPFTEQEMTKRRPALVLSDRRFGEQTGQHVLAMVTSAKRSRWPMDVEVVDLAAAGLRVACVVRMKLFALDQRLVLERAGALAVADMAAVREAVADLFDDRRATTLG